jgi:hypothetical protein
MQTADLPPIRGVNRGSGTASPVNRRFAAESATGLGSGDLLGRAVISRRHTTHDFLNWKNQVVEY